MPIRKVCKPRRLRDEEWILVQDHRVTPLARDLLERAFEILACLRHDLNNIDTDHARGIRHGVDRQDVPAVLLVEKHRNTLRRRQGLSEHLDTLRIQLGEEERRSREVSARVGKTLHEPRGHGVAGNGDHDRDGRRRRLAARPPGVPCVRMRSTPRRTSSAASAGRRA